MLFFLSFFLVLAFQANERDGEDDQGDDQRDQPSFVLIGVGRAKL